MSSGFRVKINSLWVDPMSLPGDDVPQIQIHEGRVEQDAIQKVKHASNAWKQVARILDSGFPLEYRLYQVPDDCRDAENDTKNDRMDIIHSSHVGAEEFDKRDAGQGRNDNGSTKPFPCFAGADPRNHFVASDERSNRIGSHVTELGYQNKIEQVERTFDARKEIDLLHEVEEVGHVHQAKQGA